MHDEINFWRLDKAAKVESVAHDINPLIRRARGAGLSVTAYLLELQRVPIIVVRTPNV